MENSSPVPVREARSALSTRRRALAMMLGAARWLPARPAAVDAEKPVRFAISETLVADVNLNDARAAMTIWLKRMTADLNVALEFSPKVFDTTEEIVRRARSGQLDCVALNVVEYRQIADVLDPSQIISEGGGVGLEQYLLLAKRGSGVQRLADLRGRRLCALKATKMCVSGAWLATLLDEAHLGPRDQFFASETTDSKASRVVLPVFFGQADACLTSKRSFDTMCELNPQVARELTVIATSPPMVVTFYVFHKNFHGASRERFAKVYSGVSGSVSGRQLATLFQFENLTIGDAACLAPALAVLERADRIRGRLGAGDRKA